MGLLGGFIKGINGAVIDSSMYLLMERQNIIIIKCTLYMYVHDQTYSFVFGK